MANFESTARLGIKKNSIDMYRTIEKKYTYCGLSVSIDGRKKRKLSLSLSIDREFTTIQYHIKKSFTIRYWAPWKDSNPGPRIVETVHCRTMAQGAKVISFHGLVDNYEDWQKCGMWTIYTAH